MKGLSKNISGLSVREMTRPTLTPGQKGLLKTIVSCVESSKPMDWDVVVLMYSTYVRKTYHDKYRYEYTRQNPGKEWKCDFDILEEYQNNTATWIYSIKAAVRNWFLLNLGILVMKNQLIVTPVISIE